MGSKENAALDTMWIINSKGLCLLQQGFRDDGTSIDKSIFSSFVTAILNFSDSVFSDQIDKISMGKNDVYCMPFQKGQFFVTIAAKRGANEKYIHKKLAEVGEAFQAEFGERVDSNIIYEDDFDSFIHTVDGIFGLQTVRIIEEHYDFLDLLRTLEVNNVSEDRTIEEILYFFEQLSETKRKFLLHSTLPILSIFTDSPNLSFEQMKRFQAILTINQ